MAEKIYSYADKQVMDEVGSGGGSAGGNAKVEQTVEGINKSFTDLVNIFNGGSIPFLVVDEGGFEAPYLCSAIGHNEEYGFIANFVTLRGGSSIGFAAADMSTPMHYE